MLYTLESEILPIAWDELEKEHREAFKNNHLDYFAKKAIHLAFESERSIVMICDNTITIPTESIHYAHKVRKCSLVASAVILSEDRLHTIALKLANFDDLVDEDTTPNELRDLAHRYASHILKYFLTQ